MNNNNLSPQENPMSAKGNSPHRSPPQGSIVEHPSRPSKPMSKIDDTGHGETNEDRTNPKKVLFDEDDQ